MTSSAKIDAVFVGYEDQENLGLRYIMAFLEAHGRRSHLVPYTPGEAARVVKAVKRASPALVGFSIIFQYTLPEFAPLLRALRAAGVTAHFTAGGHFPSLCPDRTLQTLPGLDSVVRFEGELTTLDLIDHLSGSGALAGVPGLAFRRGDSVNINPPRPLVDDLDSLPWPLRGELPQTCRGMGTAPILASRGCLFDCAFCSIREFYRGAPGRGRRTRSPSDVAAEMRHLYDSRGVRLFLFQDDDFAFRSAAQREWIEGFLCALEAEDLSHLVGWKISCRVDDVDPVLMSRCREHGLLVTYLGVESGNDKGLATLKKRVTAARNLSAMRELKVAGIEFDIGFMLFDPDSTFASVRENLRFLRMVAAMGGPPLSFVKMLPLAGTAIERRLAAEGRLTGSAIRPDYDLLDPRLDYYALFVTLAFSHRNSDPRGLVERLRLAYFDALVANRFEPAPWVDVYWREVRRAIDRANTCALDTLERTLSLVEGCTDANTVACSWPALTRMAALAQEEERRITEDLDAVLERFSPSLRGAFRGSAPAA